MSKHQIGKHWKIKDTSKMGKWNKNLTKETDERVKKVAEKIKEKYRKTSYHGFIGGKQSEKTKEILRNSVTNSTNKAKTASEYVIIHNWLRKTYGNAIKCENRENNFLNFKCNNKSNIFEWANKRNKPYKKNKDCFFQLCSSCHKKYDRI